MRLPLALALAALPAYASAQPASDTNHAEHHPPNASAPKAPAESLPKAAPSDTTMKSMHEMHARMMAAKTMEERQALMADHMKAMQDGMAMMSRMRGGTSSEAMSKRMDMMEMMMQMMMDREADRARAPK